MADSESDRPCRILALDGGGMRGMFTAAALAELEGVYGEDLLASFGLMVGTSTGGILALGLASGKTANEMLGFYRHAGPVIFGRPRRGRSWIAGPKYDRAKLDGVLREQFGEDLILNELRTAVCITAHELVTGTPKVWKDDHHPQLHGGGDLKVWQVAAATSAAPTYFAPVGLHGSDITVDGGVWGNNPAMVGLTEAVRYYGRDLAQIRLLSIGTTGTPLRVSNRRRARRMGKVGWALKVLPMLQGSSSTAIDRQARLLPGDSNYLRLDSEMAETIPLDDHRRAAQLEEWGRDRARNSKQAVGQLLGLL